MESSYICMVRARKSVQRRLDVAPKKKELNIMINLNGVTGENRQERSPNGCKFQTIHTEY